MEKFIPYEKLSKKKRRELAIARRGSWGALNPVTRKPENPKAYNRKKHGNGVMNHPRPCLLILIIYPVRSISLYFRIFVLTKGQGPQILARNRVLWHRRRCRSLYRHDSVYIMLMSGNFYLIFSDR
ncbi:hypothetical protein [Caproicibacter sp.]|uniref:hypothetical protein n=1 Tax=Caproicibacter sp. TaxID=2814884 RepID=UPI003989B128